MRHRYLVLLSARRVACAACIGGLLASASAETRILSMAYSGSFGLDPNIHNLPQNLQGTGFVVDSWWGALGQGQLATFLGQSTYDQIWIWDQELTIPRLNAADKAALSAWYATHPNIALDSHTLAIRTENDATETQLAHNIRDQFAAGGGGLWLGGSAAPNYAATVNSWLSFAGAGLFTGSYENGSLLSGAPGHPFLADLDVQGLRFSAVGSFVRSAAPTIGPGGIPLQTVVWDSEGHPLITTNVPEPGTVLLVAGGATHLCLRRALLRRRWHGGVR